MTIGHFQAIVRDGKPAFRNDARFREFIKEFDGKEVEVIIRGTERSKYSLLGEAARKNVMNFMDSLVQEEAMFMMTCAGNDVETLDIARFLAQERVRLGQVVPLKILEMFNLAYNPSSVMFADMPSRKSIAEAVSQ
jgi:3'-phosphoadenosine 5'-phosphosulfate sulfotransferase